MGPDHGPRVDVEQGTARAWLALTIAHAQLIARVLAAVHAPGDGAVVPGWNQRQLTQNMREAYPENRSVPGRPEEAHPGGQDQQGR